LFFLQDNIQNLKHFVVDPTQYNLLTRMHIGKRNLHDGI